MQEFIPESPQDLIQKLLGDTDGNELTPLCLFRGQSSKDWRLTPSFARITAEKGLSRRQALKLEHLLINKFHPSAINLMPIQRTVGILPTRQGIPFLDWWVIMQHYGAPTRLLDWSGSPWVALFFACSDRFQDDAKLWFIDTGKLNAAASAVHENASDLTLGLTRASTAAYVDLARPTSVDERIDIQQSFFTFHSDPTCSHDRFLEEAGALDYFIVKKGWKKELLRELARMNVTAKTLFPGIEGLAKHIREIALR